MVKSSEKIDKIKAEYDFIKKVPEDIQVFFPRLINSFEKFSEKRGQYKLEFYGYPNVSELQLYWELAPEVWVRFFEQISFVLERFKAYKYSIGKQANFEFYFTRLESRLRTFRSQLDANDKVRFFSEEIFINGKKTRSLDELLKILKTQINKLYFEDDFCIMHGDLCFNNILFDFRTGIIKLIDPRGSFGEKSPGIYGDQKYDLAKLAHSAIFGYDYLVNKLFELQEVSRNQFEININLRDNHRLLEKNTNELIKKLGYKTDEIYLITSILFLSMVPLHNDDFLKQKAMFLTGLEILGNVLTKND